MRLINIVVRTAIGIATLLTRYQGMWEGSPRLIRPARVLNGRPAFAPAAALVACPVITESPKIA